MPERIGPCNVRRNNEERRKIKPRPLVIGEENERIYRIEEIGTKDFFK
tara:strand:+ start:172 stop:315 length:144 start_codon:yes stop_codon:yes gene_type:complete